MAEETITPARKAAKEDFAIEVPPVDRAMTDEMADAFVRGAVAEVIGTRKLYNEGEIDSREAVTRAVATGKSLGDIMRDNLPEAESRLIEAGYPADMKGDSFHALGLSVINKALVATTQHELGEITDADAAERINMIAEDAVLALLGAKTGGE